MMAKEQWHNWGRTAITIVTLVFVCGITYQRIDTNTDDIDDIEVKVENVEDDVVDLKLQYKDMESLATSTNTILQELKSGQVTDRVIQNKMVTDVAVMREKVDTLTKK